MSDLLYQECFGSAHLTFRKCLGRSSLSLLNTARLLFSSDSAYEKVGRLLLVVILSIEGDLKMLRQPPLRDAAKARRDDVGHTVF